MNCLSGRCIHPNCADHRRCSIKVGGLVGFCRNPHAWNENDRVRTDRTGAEFVVVGNNDGLSADEVFSQTWRIDPASIELRNTFYRALFDQLQLSPRHTRALLRRGFQLDELQFYRSAPNENEAREAIHRAASIVKLDALAAIPGVYRRTHDKYFRLATAQGIMLASTDALGRVGFVQVRLDDPRDGGKYRALSSPSDPDVLGSGAVLNAHVARARNEAEPHLVRITEGHFKADLCALRTGITTISIPGVGMWRLALDAIEALKATRVLLCFDADARSKKHVATCLLACARELAQRLGPSNVGIELWPAECGKGIDDVIADGFFDVVTTSWGEDALASVDAIGEAAGASLDPVRAAMQRIQSVSKDRLYERATLRAVATLRTERTRLANELRTLRKSEADASEIDAVKARQQTVDVALARCTSLLGTQRNEWERRVAVESIRDDGRAPVEITTREHETVDAIIAALAERAETLGVFQRSGKLVHVRSEEATGIEKKDVKRAAGSLVIAPLEPVAFRGAIASRAVRFYVLKSNNDGELRAQDERPDGIAVNSVFSIHQWPGVPWLRGISNVPILRSDGTIHEREGYDEQTGILFSPNGTRFPEVPEHPTLEDAKSALDVLRAPFCDFPFESEHHAAAHIAVILTGCGRHAFSGPSPLPLYDAATKSSGKTKLALCVGQIVLGAVPTVISWSDDPGEVEKRAVSCLEAGDRVVLFDNLKGQLGGGALEALLTTPEYSARILGKTERRTYPNLTLWIASGNNCDLTDDMTRRTLAVRLVPKVENPEDRPVSSFRYPDVHAHVLEHRPQLVTAALTLLRAFILAGRPAQRVASWGSHSAWERLIVHALVWAGAQDPGKGRLELRRVSDGQREDIRDLIHGWKELCEQMNQSKRGITVKEALAELERNRVASARYVSPEALKYQELRDALASLVPGVFDGKGSPTKRVSALLSKHRGRIVEGCAVEVAGRDGHAEVIRWGVGAGSPGSTGSFSSPYAGDFENETNNSHASAYVGVVDKPVEPGEPAAPPAQRSASVLEGKRGDGGALEADGHGQTSELPASNEHQVSTQLPLDELLSSVFERAEGGSVRFAEVREQWEAYCADTNLDAGDSRWLANELAERGFTFAGYLVVGLQARSFAEGSAA